MPDQNPNLPQPENANFVTKPVEAPILDSGLRNRLSVESTPPVTPGGNLQTASFYSQNKWYIWAVVVGLATIAVLSFFAFRKTSPTVPKEANINLTIAAAPQQVPSGSEVVYTVGIANNDSQKLTGLQLELSYDDGLAYESSNPNADNLTGTMFTVPDLISGQNVSIFIKVKAVGAVNDQKTLSAKLHYHFSNFSSEFIKQQSASISLSAADLILELSGPTTTNNAQLVAYNVKYQNNSNQDIKNARIKLIYPPGFVFASSQPQPDLGQDTWSLPALAAAGSGNIAIQGNFQSANPGESKTAEADFLILGDNGQYVTQNSSTFITAISSLPLNVSQQLVSAQPKAVIDPGDNLAFDVQYQNNNSTAANGVNIVVTLDSKALDLSTVRAEGAQIVNNTITWNASSYSQLATLSPNESGHLSYSVQIKNPATKDSTKNLTMTSNIKIKSKEYDSFFPGNTVNMKISSPANLTASVSYVSGAMPPQVGNTTIYRVHLALINSSNDFSNGQVALFVPLGAGGFVDKSQTLAESNNVQFDQSTNKLVWNVGSLPAYTGKFSQPRVLDFNVKLNPSASQAQSSPVLVKSMEFTATDTFTAQNVDLTADNLTTSDIPSSSGYGSGIVQP